MEVYAIYTIIYMCFAKTTCPLRDLSVSQLSVACSVYYYVIGYDKINPVVIKTVL